MISPDVEYNFWKDTPFLRNNINLRLDRSEINLNTTYNVDKPDIREEVTIAFETPLTALERLAKTEYTTRAYFNVEKKSTRCQPKAFIVPVNGKD